jgi:maleamate amidohydrolase
VNVPTELADTFSFYLERGLGARVGFGSRPAIVVVDLVNAFTDPGAPLGADLSAEIDSAVRILTAARALGTPVVFSTVAYEPDLGDAGNWIRKIPANAELVENTPATQVDPRMGRRDGERILVKKFASCFFATDLATRLVADGVDTVIIVGATTSGCVRATAVDSCSHGFHTIVVQDAVGDRAELPHYVSLFDIDAKYGDVVDEDTALAYLTSSARAGRQD